MLIIKRPWTRQPQRPVRLRGAVNAPNAIYGIGSSPSVGSNWAPSAHVIPDFGNGGRAVRSLNTGDLPIATPSNWTLTSAFTLLALVEFDSGSNYQSIIDRDPGSGRQFQFRRTNTDTLEFLRFDTGGNPYFATTSQTIPNSRVVAVAATSNGAAMRAYLANGEASGTISNTPKPFDGTYALCSSWAGTANVTSQDMAGRLYFYAILPYASEALARDFIASGYAAVFEPRRIFVPTYAASTSPALLTASAFNVGTTSATARVSFSR